MWDFKIGVKHRIILCGTPKLEPNIRQSYVGVQKKDKLVWSTQPTFAVVTGRMCEVGMLTYGQKRNIGYNINTCLTWETRTPTRGSHNKLSGTSITTVTGGCGGTSVIL